MKPVSFIPSLTPLRGIAAILVVFFHFNIFLAPLAPDDVMVFDKLYLMVDLFFVLSGFIMYHVYGSWFAERIEKGRFFQYMKARFARLYPIHIVMLLYLVVISIVLRLRVDFSQLPTPFQNVLDLKAIPTSILMIQAWGMHLEAPWNTASWSISVEWFLYLLFPVLIAFMVKYKSIARWILGLSSLVGLLVIMFYIQPYFQTLWDAARDVPEGAELVRPVNTIDLITGPALFRGLCGFVIGMITYELYQKKWQINLFKKGFWFVGTWVLMLVMWIGDWLPDILAVILFALLILHGAYVEGLTKRILNNKLFTYLGDISYSIYMVHIPVILSIFIMGIIASGQAPAPAALEVTPEDAPPVNYLMHWVGALVFLFVVIGIASLTYRFIELPMRKWIKERV